MIRSRWWTLVAVLAIGLSPAVPGTYAGEPEGKGKVSCASSRQASADLTEKTYPVGKVVQDSDSADLLVRAITRAVKPSSWSKHGGAGTIEYYSSDRTLLVKQTPEAHKQVSSILKALATLQPRQAAYSCAAAPSTPSAGSASSDQVKQYGHFVLDHVRLNAMGVSCTIKRIRFLYKGDGLDNEVAKCALTNGESEKKADVQKVLTEVLEKLEKTDAAKTPACICVPACPATSSCGAACGALIGSACTMATTKTDKAELKKACGSDSKTEKGTAKPE